MQSPTRLSGSRLGLEEQNPDWLKIQFARLVADNTTCCTAVMPPGNQLWCQFVPVARSDMNSTVERSPSFIASDHNMHGRHGEKERGEASADEDACHTIIEAICETARDHAHNTMPLD